MDEKYRMQRLIDQTVLQKGYVEVSSLLLEKVFPQSSAYSESLELVAFTSANRPVPPQTTIEQINRFCEVRDFTWHQIENGNVIFSMKNTGMSTTLSVEYD